MEIFNNNRWGGVCDKGFTTTELKSSFAKAACATMGQLYGEWVEPLTEEGSLAYSKMDCRGEK